MSKIDNNKVKQLTNDYAAWLHKQLKDQESARAHLQVALDTYQQDQDKQALLLALRDVAQAQGGIGWLAQQTQLNREHLYYLLSGRGNPRIDTLSRILNAFGFHLRLDCSKTYKQEVIK